VVFSSFDSNLVANDSNGQIDIFVRDLAIGSTERVNIANDGSQANSLSNYPGISANGRYVGFNSMATNLVTGGTPQGLATFVRDRIANTTEMVDIPHDGSVANNFSFGHSVVSGDGRYIVSARKLRKRATILGKVNSPIIWMDIVTYFKQHFGTP